MRLWSLSPRYLDRMGLLAVWRESLLAQSVLLKGEYTKCSNCKGSPLMGEVKCTNLQTGKGYIKEFWCTKCKETGKIKTPYYNHPQLERFKKSSDSVLYINAYLNYIWQEADRRGYKFDINKLIKYEIPQLFSSLTVTKEQLNYEFKHLQKKLHKRDYEKYVENVIESCSFTLKVEPHPLFEIIEGEIESWEKVKDNL